jgi:ABC-type maltose transport system permease subunit
VFAVLGASFASECREPGDYACGLGLSLAAIALAFMRLKSRFDGRPADWGSFLLVDDMPNLVAVVAIFTVLALAGLFFAARFDHGGLHDAGIALFVASGLAVFLSLKHVFDNLDRRT